MKEDELFKSDKFVEKIIEKVEPLKKELEGMFPLIKERFKSDKQAQLECTTLNNSVIRSLTIMEARFLMDDFIDYSERTTLLSILKQSEDFLEAIKKELK